MLDGFRLSSAVSSITNQKYAVTPEQDYKAFARTMSDKIMANYRDDAPALKGLPIRRQAIRLTTDVMIELEYEYEAMIDAEEDDAVAGEILTTIEWLRECLVDYGQMYGEQLYVAECLAHHEKVLQGLLGGSPTMMNAERAPRSSASASK